MGDRQGSSLGKEGGLQNPIQLEMKKGIYPLSNFTASYRYSFLNQNDP